MSEAAPPRPGCFTLGLIFGAVTVSGWVITILLYGLIVEQWGLIAVRREFGYDMGLLWAPLTGLVLATLACFWVTRGAANAARGGLIAGVALLVALALLIGFAGLGTVF
jgi:hypothetical protein